MRQSVPLTKTRTLLILIGTTSSILLIDTLLWFSSTLDWLICNTVSNLIEYANALPWQLMELRLFLASNCSSTMQESVTANIPVHEMVHEKFLLSVYAWEKQYRDKNPNLQT